MQDTKLLTPREQADELRVCLRHLSTLTKKRLIPAVRLGRCLRYDPAAVRRALEKLTIKEIA